MIYTDDYDGPYLKKFAIPFYHTKIENWDIKRLKLDEIFDAHKHHMTTDGDQLTDYDTNRQYHFLLEGILMDDLIRVKKVFGIEKQIRINSAWFQQYNRAHSHHVHNHGFGGFSSVLYLRFDPAYHRPTTFVAPFLNNFDGNVFEYIPPEVEEGDLIVFPTSLAHYVPVNTSDVERRILSMNMN
tara:strand:- start:4199 stop:4750 length:552 start_codon:yes stop_codon:yes gene_type:complete